MTSVWLLAVVSSDAQSDTLADQRGWAESLCREKGWALQRVFEGVSSGNAGPRKLLRELITSLRATAPTARPAYVLMIRADRIGRGRISDSLLAQDEIVHDLGVGIWTRSEGDLKLDSPMDQLLAAVRAATASQDNHDRRDKITNVYKRRREAGAASITNKAPYGLHVTKGGVYEVVPDQAEAVRRAFALRIEGNGYHVIANHLRGTSAPARRKDGTERPVPWVDSRVARMLGHRGYCGTIVDEMTFHRAQLVRERMTQAPSTKTVKYPWPLSGSIRCYCGSSMGGRTGGPRSSTTNRLRYYACRNYGFHGHLVSLRAEKAEAQFDALLERLHSDPEAVVKRGSGPSVELIDRNIKSVRAELDFNEKQRLRVWELNAAGKVRDDDLQAHLDTLNDARTDLKGQLSALVDQRGRATAAKTTVKQTAEVFAAAKKLWRDDASTVPDRQRLARMVALHLGGLYIDQKGRLEVGTPSGAPARKHQRVKRAVTAG
jgi:DNA invertase Pin-like site-specific DNA recombinase